MDMVIIILTEVSQTETKTIWYHLPAESLKEKKIQMNLFTRQKQNYRLRKQTSGYQKVKVGGTDKSGA